MCGPKLLRRLFDMLLEFRAEKIAVCGDRPEMYQRSRVGFGRSAIFGARWQ